MSLFKKLTFSLIILITFLLCGEFLLAISDVNLKLLKKTLFYQAVDVKVFRISSFPKRAYELIPGASCQSNEVYPKEKYTTRSVKINSLGFRDKERSKEKKKGIYRIVILGDSNTYGAAVDNEDTYPAVMQRIFDKTYPKRIEVWNAGVCGYVMSQKVAYAEDIIKKFNPNLLVFQDHNRGRRLFLLNTGFKDLKKLFLKDRELYAENIPFFTEDLSFLYNAKYPSFPSWVSKSLLSKTLKIHYFFVLHSNLYRFLFINTNIFLLKFKRWGPWWEGSIYAEANNQRSFISFIKKNKNIKIILFDNIGRYQLFYDPKKFDNYKNIRYFSLNIKNMPIEFSECHPPSYVYEWYAQELYDFLIKNNYVD